jgi:5-methylcytosine-specific restriction protein A
MWRTAAKCAEPACGLSNVRGSRFCEKHQTDNYEIRERKRFDRDEREPWHRWYSLAFWKRTRASFLSNGMQAICAVPGCNRPAEEVDHKIPHRGDWALFTDPKNLQGLCKRHHSQKTAKEVWI